MNKMGTEDVTMPLSIYVIGFILAICLAYAIELKERDITIGDLIATIFLGGFSWIAVLICIIAYICANEDKVIIKRKSRKRKKSLKRTFLYWRNIKRKVIYKNKQL